MERKRIRCVSRTGNSSPPKSVKISSSNTSQVGLPDIMTRTFNLITSRGVLPFYVLALFFSFYFGPIAERLSVPRPPEFVVFRVLPVVYLVALVGRPLEITCPIHDHARKYILIGMALHCIGDGIQAYDPENLVYSAALFQFGYLCYSIAFFQYYKPNEWAKFVFPINAAIAGVIIYSIQDPITSGVVAFYTFFLTILSFLASTRLETCLTGAAYVGWAGVQLLILSDVLLAINLLMPSLEHPIPEAVHSMTDYLGLMGIALSTYTIKAGGRKDSVVKGVSARSASASTVMSSGTPLSID